MLWVPELMSCMAWLEQYSETGVTPSSNYGKKVLVFMQLAKLVFLAVP